MNSDRIDSNGERIARLEKALRDLETFKFGEHRDKLDMLMKRVEEVYAQHLEERIAALEPKFAVGDKVMRNDKELVVRGSWCWMYKFKNVGSYPEHDLRAAPKPEAPLAERLQALLIENSSLAATPFYCELVSILSDEAPC